MVPDRHRDGRREAPIRRLQPMVQRLIDNAASYEPRAQVGDGLCINEVILVKAQQPGAASALHAKWQEEGYADHLSREECEQLARAGYKINKDPDGFWAWWREKRLSHLWLTVGPHGWRVTRAPHPKGANWNLVGSFYEPAIPYFDDYAVSPQTIIREGLVMAITVLRPDIPQKVFQEKFFAVAKDICDEAVNEIDQDVGWFKDIVQRVHCVDPEDNEAGYSGGAVS